MHDPPAKFHSGQLVRSRDSSAFLPFNLLRRTLTTTFFLGRCIYRFRYLSFLVLAPWYRDAVDTMLNLSRRVASQFGNDR